MDPGVGVGQRETTDRETRERWRPLVTPRQVRSAQHRYSDVFWEIRFGNLVILRSWEEGLENYSSTVILELQLQGFFTNTFLRGVMWWFFEKTKVNPQTLDPWGRASISKLRGWDPHPDGLQRKAPCLMHLRVVGECGDTLEGEPPAGGGESSPDVSTVGAPWGGCQGAWPEEVLIRLHAPAFLHTSDAITLDSQRCRHRAQGSLFLVRQRPSRCPVPVTEVRMRGQKWGPSHWIKRN